MNGIETVLWFLSMAICFRIIAYKSENKQKTMICMLFCAFATFVLLYKATQYDITDSEKYLHKFVALQDIKSIYPDALYQYRITLLVTCIGMLLFRIFRISTIVSINTLEQFALALHVFLSFIFLILIVVLGFRCFLREKMEKNKESLFFTAILAVFICCPVLILEMRAYNYDSFSMMLGIIALELAAMAIKNDDRRWLWGGIITATLATFEKVMAGPVLILCIVLTGILDCQEIKNVNHIAKIVKSVVIGCFVYLLTAILLQMGIEWLIVREPGNSITFVSIFYPLCSSFDILFGNFAYSDIKRECLLLMLAICVFIIFSVVGGLLIQIIKKHSDTIFKVIPVVNAITLMIICGIGIISTYTIKMKIYPYDNFRAGESQICPNFTGAYYHYGAATALGQYFLHFCNAMANIINKITTGHLLLISLYIVIILRKKHKTISIQDLLPHLGISLSVFMCILYAVAGVPSDSRYKSLYIGGLIIGCVIVIFCEIKVDEILWRAKIALSVICVISMIEIVIYTPNEMPFKPSWNINCAKYPRQGIWDAGEPMQWGVQNMLVGEKIKKWADTEKIDYSDITIYCDYVGGWFENPGINMEYIVFTDELNQSKYNFYINSRFMLFRKEIPGYIYNEVPFMEISYRGETATWVYLVIAE